MGDPLDDFGEFSRCVRARLELGKRQYGERSAGRPLAELAAELEEEVLDLMGWSFWVWRRVRQLREIGRYIEGG